MFHLNPCDIMKVKKALAELVEAREYLDHLFDVEYCNAFDTFFMSEDSKPLDVSTAIQSRLQTYVRSLVTRKLDSVINELSK